MPLSADSEQVMCFASSKNPAITVSYPPALSLTHKKIPARAHLYHAENLRGGEIVQEIVVAYAVGNICSPDEVVAFCNVNQAEFAVVGPEAPLNAGMVDALEASGVRGIGPTKALAQVECSKQFARNVMHKHSVPGCPLFRAFSSIAGQCSLCGLTSSALQARRAG